MVTAHGPIDFVLIEFPTDRLTGEAGAGPGRPRRA